MKEIWKDIENYEGIYQINNFGKVRCMGGGKTRNKKGLMMAGSFDKGYKQYLLFKNGKSKTIRAHRLVAKAFLPNLNNYEVVNHKNGIKDDNCVDNLEWCNNGYNQTHACVMGMRNTKLNFKDVLKIRKIKKDNPKVMNKELAELFKISDSIISEILSNKIWNFSLGAVDGSYNFNKKLLS